MVGNILENNMVTISGKIETELGFSHEVYGEGFYSFLLKVPRLSEHHDKIPVTISERLITNIELKKDMYVEVEGQFRSYNNYNGMGNKLLLTVFAREIKLLEDDDRSRNPNQVYLNGFICKRPIYRTTPFGREIADVLLAVNRAYNKSDYIPCICWGRNARYTEELGVGDNIKIWGRVQSREYQKKFETGEALTRTAYEVSVTKLEVSKGELPENKKIGEDDLSSQENSFEEKEILE